MSTIAEAESLGQLLRLIRLKSGLTQQQLADLATVSVRAVRDLESGRVRAPRRHTVRLLARELRMSERTRERFEALALDTHDTGGGPSTPAGDVGSRTGDLRPPLPLEALLCRESELRAMHGMLNADQSRLVGVTGLAGVGKSRLAAEVAVLWQRSGVPAFWIPLQRNPAGVADVERVSERIGDRHSLLVLDGLGGAEERCPDVAGLLQRCPNLRVITTAHGPVDSLPQTVFALQPLAEPHESQDGSPDELARVASVDFLLNQIRKSSPEFVLTKENSADVAAICRLLIGLPYALQAAGAWFLMYSSDQLLRKIRSNPAQLTSPFGTGRSLGDLLRLSTCGLSDKERSLVHRAALDERGADIAALAELHGDTVGALESTIYRIVASGLLRVENSSGGLRLRAPALIRSWLLATGTRDSYQEVS